MGKNVQQQYLLHMTLQYGELWPTSGWDPSGLGTPANFNGFRFLAVLIQWRRWPEANQTLHDVWLSLGVVHYIYIFGGSCPPDGILPGAKLTLRPSLVFSYIGSVTARHYSSRRQPNFVAWYTEWNYGTFVDGATYIWLRGHHDGHQPTF